ncbi:hypothetical protein, partial [Escherichia coli]
TSCFIWENKQPPNIALSRFILISVYKVKTQQLSMRLEDQLETLNNLLVTLTSAKPEVLVSVVSLGAMVFMYMIIKLFISLLDRKWGKNER